MLMARQTALPFASNVRRLHTCRLWQQYDEGRMMLCLGHKLRDGEGMYHLSADLACKEFLLHWTVRSALPRNLYWHCLLPLSAVW